MQLHSLSRNRRFITSAKTHHPVAATLSSASRNFRLNHTGLAFLCVKRSESYLPFRLVQMKASCPSRQEYLLLHSDLAYPTPLSLRHLCGPLGLLNSCRCMLACYDQTSLSGSNKRSSLKNILEMESPRRRRQQCWEFLSLLSLTWRWQSSRIAKWSFHSAHLSPNFLSY